MSSHDAAVSAAIPAGPEEAERGKPVLRRWLASSRPIWLMNFLLGATAVALFLGPVDWPKALISHYLPWWSLAIGFLIAERCVVHLHFKRSAHSFSLGDIPLVFGLLFASAHELVIGTLIGTTVVLVLDRRLPLIKLIFNLAQFCVGASLAILVLHTVVPDTSGLGPDVWLGVMLATLASAVFAVLLISVVISLSEGLIRLKTFVHMLMMDLVVTVTNTSLALAGAVIVWNDARAIPLLAVPVVTVFLAYRAYILERQRHERLEFLYDATRTLARSPEIVRALGSLLEGSLDAFRAEVAEIVLLGYDGNPSTRTTLGRGIQKEELQPIDERIAQDLLSRVNGERAAVRLERPFGSEVLRRYFERRQVTHSMVALMPGEKRVVGTIMLANRSGVVRSFSDDDLKLFEALASNASFALQNDELEETVLELRDLQGKLEHQASHDPLTDLANRSLFHKQVNESLKNTAEEVAVLFIDVDDFKTVNDSLGHEAGDKLLVLVAERLRDCIRPSDVVARLGGDEFAVKVEDPSDAQAAALKVTNRIMRAFERPIHNDGRNIFVHLSVGITTTHLTGRRADELIRDADVAMYSAKAGGKHCYALFQPSMRRAVLKRHGLKEELRDAIEREELMVHYQPIVDLESDEVVAAEALVRWNRREVGKVMPAEFVPLAEETGLIVSIGEFVLNEACRQARRWQEADPTRKPINIHVNLSAVEVQDEWVIDRVTAAIQNAGIEPQQLVLEITESVLVDDAELVATKLEQLRRVGVRLALDDFGTGYSSLSYLRSLPLDMLKIAMPFVEGITRGKQESSFVRMIMELARTLGLDVIAEGIESPDQLAALRELGCEMGQGFHLGLPAGADNPARASVEATAA
jgi:diguanylate cyclase (GGDEF)-like protein